MRLIATTLLLLAGTLSGCLGSEADETIDLTAPVIGPRGSTQGIAPARFLEVGPKASHIPLAFEVTDERGISEIGIESHNGFDGHLHGRGPTGGEFVLLNYRQTLLAKDFPDATRFETRADDELSIFLDERNPNIPAGARLLAGPYHFSIKAVDASGNETSYDDNSTYHSTIYLQRSYAPAVEVASVDRASGSLNGTVKRNTADEASSNIVFLWVYVTRPNPANPAQEGELVTEWLWGKSNWPHQFRANSGTALPSGNNIDLATLLSSQAAIRQMASGDQLRVWVEDANGNITLKTFN